MAQTTSELIARYSSKAAGVYREIIDATSEPLAVSPQNVVVVGQFEQGPFMRPIYCENLKNAKAIFGKRNAKLEAKGCYGMLVAEHLLENGAIWILNIKDIDQYNETLQVKKFAVNSNEIDELINAPIASVYDTNKFWKIDEMFGKHGDGASIAFASVAQEKLTIVIEKYWSKDLNYTVGETKKYNDDFTGDNLNDNDFVNDYLIRVHVFKTNLSTAMLSVANAFIDGRINLKVLSQIEDDPASKFFAVYTGTICDVIDINGNNLNISTAINADKEASGLFMAVNGDALASNPVDLNGTEGIVYTEGELPDVQEISRLGYMFTPSLQPNCIHINNNDNTAGYMFGSSDLVIGDTISNEAKIVRVLSKQIVQTKFSIPVDAVLGSQTYPIMPNGLPFIKTSNAIVYPSYSPKAGMPVEYNADKAIWFTNEYVIVHGTWLFEPFAPVSTNTTGTISYIYNGESFAQTFAIVAGTTASALLDLIIANINVPGITFASIAGAENHSISTTNVDTTVFYFSITGLTIDAIDIEITSTANVAKNALSLQSYDITVAANTTVTCNDETNDIDITAVTDMYGTAMSIYKLSFSEALNSAIFTNLPISATNGATFGTAYNTIINGATVSLTAICAFKLVKWYDTVTLASVHPIQGIVSLEKHYVNGSVARQNAILDRLQDIGITTSFSDPTIFRCRYMIDAFKTYIEPSAKHQYAQLANEAKRFICIIPAPFYHELRSSKNPDFHSLTGEFDMTLVAQGYNPDKPSTNSFSYPNSGDAAKFIYPVMNVVYNDGFSSKVIPATGAVGKLFYSKLSGTHKVYDIVAGPDWIINGSGIVKPEFESGPDDRAAMEKLGTNVLQLIDGNIQIRSSKTAYQTVLSAFNYPESVEKCLYVSDSVEPTLAGKLFKYNNADARLAVKTKADSVCDIMVADGVIADYSNQCDIENNPTDVQKNGIIVLDTVLYNAYGIRIAIHRTTIKDPKA